MSLSPLHTMEQIDTLLAHVWMVRAFVKHSDEAAEDDELAEVHRELYDYMLALGQPLSTRDGAEYVRVARKKFARLKKAADNFVAIQPEISTHTNFQMAARSLTAAVSEIGKLLDQAP